MITYSMVILLVLVIFSYSYPIFKNMVYGQVNKIDDNIPTVSYVEETVL